MFELALTTTMDRPVLTAPDFGANVWGARTTVRTGEMPSESLEPITPDTEVALTVTEMAERLDKLGTRTTQAEVELSVDPDDYPLF